MITEAETRDADRVIAGTTAEVDKRRMSSAQRVVAQSDPIRSQSMVATAWRRLRTAIRQFSAARTGSGAD